MLTSYQRIRKQRIDIIRLKLLKIAAKAIHSARYVTFKLCSSCPYTDEFYETLSNISKLQVQLKWQLLTNFDSWITTQNPVIGILCPFGGQKRLVEAACIKFRDSWRSF